MRISVSKKALAVALSLAMLVTCMAFSFSASAAVVKLWENHFDNPSTTNWNSVYGDKSASSNFNTGTCNDTNFQGYAVPVKDGDNGYMAVGWNNAKAQQRPIGFIVMHQGTTNKTAANVGTYGHAGKYRYDTLAGGSFQPDSGKYAIRLDYQVPDTVDLSGTDIEIYVAFSNKLWKGVSTWGTDNPGIQYLESAGDLVKYPIATITDANQTAEWQSTTTYVDLTVPSDKYWYTSIIVRASNISDDKLAGAEIYIDNIEIHKYDDDADFPSVSYSYGGNVIATSSGLGGSPYTMPKLSGLPENEHATYWADPDFQTPATIPTVYPAESQTIYVKTEKYMVNDPWSFESEAVDMSVSSNGTTFGDYKVSDKAAHSGSKSLKLDCSKGFATSTNANTTQFMLKNGSGDYAEVEIGKTYLISYWVMVPETMTTSFENCLWLIADPTKTGSYSFTGSIYNTVERIFRQNSNSYVTVKNDGQWHQIVCKIDGSRIGNVYADKLHGYGKVLVGLSNKVAQEGLSVYVDDIDLICLDDLAAESTELTAYLYRGETANGVKTNLHSHTTTKTGIYTSLRLGAKYTAGDSNGDTIMMGGVALPLSARGIVVGKEDMALNIKGTKNTDYLWSSYKTSGLDQYWTADGNELSYTLRLANMGKEWFESANEYVWRSCFEVTLPSYYKESAADTPVPNEKVLIYGDTSDALTFGAMVENNFTTDYWFSDMT